jgi:hypothetical protein
VPAPPASELPPLPTTYYMTRNITWIQHCIKWRFKSPAMWHCCWTSNAHWLEGTTIFSNMRNCCPIDTVPHPTEHLTLQQHLEPYAVSKWICWPWQNYTVVVNTGNPCLIQWQATHSSTRLVIQQLCTTY